MIVLMPWIMHVQINDVLVQGHPQKDIIGMIKAASIAPIRFVVQVRTCGRCFS